MEKNTKNNIIEFAEELYESSKKNISEVFEMGIDELDYTTLDNECTLIVRVAELLKILNDKENKDDSTEDKLINYIKSMFENRDELRDFLQNILYEPNSELDEFEEEIDCIVKLVYN